MQHTEFFVNLPVADLDRSRAFYTALGYSIEESVSDDKALAVVLGPSLTAMLLRQDFFDTFHRGRSARTGDHEAVLCVSVESAEDVDALVDAAVAAGGTEVASERHGEWMYWRSYTDPDGHIWEPMWMDFAAAQQAGEFGG